MKTQEIADIIGELEQIWDDKGNKCTIEDISKIDNCILYGDDGGDTFIKIANDETDLINKLKKHLDGNTGCDFETSIRLIIRNGKSVKVSSFLK